MSLWVVQEGKEIALDTIFCFRYRQGIDCLLDSGDDKDLAIARKKCKACPKLRELDSNTKGKVASFILPKIDEPELEGVSRLKISIQLEETREEIDAIYGPWLDPTLIKRAFNNFSRLIKGEPVVEVFPVILENLEMEPAELDSSPIESLSGT